MIYTITNNHLVLSVDTAGAEMKSIFHKSKAQEFLWQGSTAWWPRRAPVLFPIVGKLNGNNYRIGNATYSLPQHGFARDSEFLLQEQQNDRLVFALFSNDETRKKYPFDFELQISYSLAGTKITVAYKIMNKDSKMMPFSIGAHPGFALHPGEHPGDYFIEFEKRETLDRHLIENGVFNGKTERVITDSTILDLTDEQFTKDAIVLKHMKSSRLTLSSRRSDYFLQFEATGFPYFGIWSKPGAPFICLEPWCGLADNAGFAGELQSKEGIEHLLPGKSFDRSFSFSL